jgi:hypothetical protein
MTMATEFGEDDFVPRISEFYGIVITMYVSEHGPPHFHARYGEFRATFGVDPVVKVAGRLTRRAEAMVVEWARLHQREIDANWELLNSHRAPNRIAPLD